MAKITVTFTGVSHYESSSSESKTTAAFSLATSKETATLFIAADDKAKTIQPYNLSISDFSLHKKMYEPTEIIIDISITSGSGNDTDYKEVGRNVLEDLFKHTKVDISTLGTEYYVHEVLPRYGNDAMHVTLKVFSLDKLLTIKKASRTWTSMRLATEIMAPDLAKTVKPWTAIAVYDLIKKMALIDKRVKELDLLLADNTLETVKKEAYTTEKEALTAQKVKLEQEKIEKESEQKPLTLNVDNMKFLRWVSGTVKDKDKNDVPVYQEHLFPYLVQYNESFWDMVTRTANRWGEFLYVENGILTFGYDPDPAKIKAVDRKAIKEISYFDLHSKSLKVCNDGEYFLEAANQNSLTGKPLTASPYINKGQIDFADKQDKWVMKQLASVFKNDKSLSAMIINMLIDNLFNLAQASASTKTLNNRFDDKYFKDSDKNDSYHGDYDFGTKKGGIKFAYQQFTEINNEFNDKKYKEILKKEEGTGKDAILIDYNTTNPELQLGSIISFNGENFIVVEIVTAMNSQFTPVFKVVASSQDSDKKFYPAVIPAGHVRYAQPMQAYITDTDDPCPQNRVRVMFSWQCSWKDDKGNEQIIWEDDDNKGKGVSDAAKSRVHHQSTPWLLYSSNQNGYPTVGYHYVGNPVMVGFEGGNVERPYVIGGLSTDFFLADSILTSPGMHQLSLTDGWGDGLTAFLSGCFSPLLKTIMGFMPGVMPKFDFKQSKYLEGGFELTDYYGTYKISGTTDGRNVSIASNWGDVKINAFTGISISAPNGDVKISGKNVTIEAGNNLNLVSGTNVDYKIWKTKDTKKGTVAQFMLDATAAVAKKLAQVALSCVDLSLVRSTVEIFFRPVEGALTVKSNRFLKLEAGKSKCDYPEIAFNKKKKQDILDEANKAAIISGIKISEGLVDIFKKIPVNTDKIIDQFIAEYNICCDALVDLNKLVDVKSLKYFSEGDQQYVNDDSQLPCKWYDDLKEDLWSQEKDEDWKEDKLGFTDEVKLEGKPSRHVLRRVHPAGYNTIKEYENDCKFILERRKHFRNVILSKVNNLRKHIYKLTHLEPDKIAVNKMFNPMILESMPKDYKKKLISAFSKKKCPDLYFYNLDDAAKKLDAKINADFKADKIYMKRLVTVNLLDEFGFTDDTRKEVNVDLTADPPKMELPKKPKLDDLDAENPESIMNDTCWQNYVKSLNALPKLEFDATTVGGVISNAVKGELAAFKERVKFWKGAAERGTWGDGKKGQILFGVDEDTYCLGSTINKMDSKLSPTFNSVTEDTKGLKSKDKETLSYYMNKLRTLLSDF